MIATHTYAKLPLALLIEPAIELAEFGYGITDREAQGETSSIAFDSDECE
jgi:gamma-glutamyltranspeptidase